MALRWQRECIRSRNGSHDSIKNVPTKRQNAVSVAIFHNNQFLLVKRKNEPSKGLWAFPGGKVEAGESFIMAAAREVLEETALHVDRLELVSVLEIGSKYLLHVFTTSHFNGVAKPMDDAADCGWFTLDQMPDLPATLSTMEIAHNIFNQK